MRFQKYILLFLVGLAVVLTAASNQKTKKRRRRRRGEAPPPHCCNLYQRRRNSRPGRYCTPAWVWIRRQNRYFTGISHSASQMGRPRKTTYIKGFHRMVWRASASTTRYKGHTNTTGSIVSTSMASSQRIYSLQRYQSRRQFSFTKPQHNGGLESWSRWIRRHKKKLLGYEEH